MERLPTSQGRSEPRGQTPTQTEKQSQRANMIPCRPNSSQFNARCLPGPWHSVAQGGPGCDRYRVVLPPLSGTAVSRVSLNLSSQVLPRSMIRPPVPSATYKLMCRWKSEVKYSIQDQNTPGYSFRILPRARCHMQLKPE